MIRYLLDTNAVGDLINCRHGIELRVDDARIRGNMIGTCEPVVAELYFGVENCLKREDNLKRLRRGLSGLKCWPLTRPASQEYGKLMTTLQQQGRQIAAMDGLIAAIALSLPRCIVVTCDSDLSRVPGLKVENWRT